MQPTSMQVGAKALPVWPQGQQLSAEADPTIRITTFSDIDDYHPQLVTGLLALEQHEDGAKRFFRGAGGTKIYDVQRWAFQAADLIDARAKVFFKQVLGCDSAVTESSWANIYRSGDYCMPHSHVRCAASIVYFVALGDGDPTDPFGGRFFFADPRLGACCRDEQGCLTNPLLPEVCAGSMIIFPGQLIHCVNPYTGETPRITLAWNINPHAVAGSPHPDEP